MDETFVARMAINVALQRAIAHLKHLLHILTKKSIATCFSSSYLCLRQNDTTDVNFQNLKMNTSNEKSNL